MFGNILQKRLTFVRHESEALILCLEMALNFRLVQGYQNEGPGSNARFGGREGRGRGGRGRRAPSGPQISQYDSENIRGPQAHNLQIVPISEVETRSPRGRRGEGRGDGRGLRGGRGRGRFPPGRSFPGDQGTTFCKPVRRSPKENGSHASLN